MADKVTLDINFKDGGGNDPPKPFGNVKPISEELLKDLILPDLEDTLSSIFQPVEDDFTKLYKSLSDFALLGKEGFSFLDEDLNRPEFEPGASGKSVQDLFKEIDSLSDGFADITHSIGMMQDEYADLFANMNTLDEAFEEITPTIKTMGQEFDDMLVETGESFAAMCSSIGDTIGYITTWGERVFATGAALASLFVSTTLYNEVLKAILDSLGEFSAELKIARGQNNRELMMQNLANSQRLSEQLASNERIRGELAGQIEIFKTEMFDLFSPVIKVITAALATILILINAILYILNLIKDAILLPFTLIQAIVNLLNPLSLLAKEELKDKLNKKSPGFGDVVAMFDPDYVNNAFRSTMPPGMYNDIVNNPFDFDGVNESRPSGPPGSGGPVGGVNGGGGF